MASSLITFSGPPGSGKSDSLVREALRLVKEEGLRPDEITLVAMNGPGKGHLEALVEERCTAAGLPHRNFAVVTFETLCRELLRRYSTAIRPDFQLLSGEDTRLILCQIGRELARERPEDELHYTLGRYSFARTVADLTERLRLCGLSAADLAGFPDERGHLLAEFMTRFETRTLGKGLLTYPDLLRETARLLASPEALSAIRQDYRALLIDEAQELGRLHFDILRPLLPDTCLVLAGTEHLNIRGFPGSEPGFARLSEVFPGVPISPMIDPEQVSSADRNTAVLWLASQWQDKHYNLPRFWEARPPVEQADSPYRERLKETVRFGFFLDFRSEAAAVARQIRRIQKDTGRPWRDFAILLRNSTHQESLDALQGALTEADIPVNVNGMPETAFRVQALLFHALKVFEQRQILHSDTPDHPLTVMDRTEAVRALNRHLSEWLSRLPGFAAAHDLLAKLYDEETALTGMDMLDGYRDGHPLSRKVGDFLTFLDAAGRRYTAGSSLYALCWAILEHGDCLTGLEAAPGEPAGVLANFLKALRQQEENVVKATGQPVPLSGFEDWYAGLWDTDQSHGDRVRILSLFQCQGQRFPVVFLPGLVAGSFPKTVSERQFFTPDGARTMENLLARQGLDPARTRLPLLQDQRRVQLEKEAALMTLALTRTGESVFLSSHRNTESDDRLEAAQPSPFYRELLKHWQAACVEADWLARIEDDESPAFGWLGEQTAESAVPDAFAEERTYHGASPWSRLPRQAGSPVYDPDETLYLSASSLDRYVTCPRQYFYGKVLGIKTPGNAFASVGSAVHKVMEHFNKTFPREPYTYERLQALAGTFFDEDQAVFDAEDVAFLKTLDPVALHDLKNDVFAALEDLQAKKFFDNPPRTLKAEHEFRFRDPDLPGAEFHGFIDALLEDDAGRWTLMDYKFFSKSRFASGDPEDELRKTFEPLHLEGEGTHPERFGDDKRYYQVPLYFLAMQHDEEFRGKVHTAGLQVIRAASGKKNGGSLWLGLDAAELAEKLPALKDDLRAGVLEPLKAATALEANPGKACEYCSFITVCDAGEVPEEDDE